MANYIDMEHESVRERLRELPKDPGRLLFHMMPPVGWLNDPNGLCYFKGVYHVFFQYAPSSPTGGPKVWGHYAGTDLVHWRFCGEAIVPSVEYDRGAILSGSTLVDGDRMYSYYTGIVIDHTLPRELRYRTSATSTVCAVSEDGYHFTEKYQVTHQSQYPACYTRHVRDPKAWKQDGKYYFLLGCRTVDDVGGMLLYSGDDPVHMTLAGEITTREKFGYMWECPDLFWIGDQQILGMSPQGVEREEYRFQNIYTAGYFPVKGDLRGTYEFGEFREWDYGFDFYAPQTFEGEGGRRILIGWASVSDAQKEYTNPSVEYGWQHALTVPREVTYRDGVCLQYPVEELKTMRGTRLPLAKGRLELPSRCFDLELEKLEGRSFGITVGQGVTVSFADGEFRLSLTPEAGRGRTVRKVKAGKVTELRILADTTLMEIFVNRGEFVFTTRYYVEEQSLEIRMDHPEVPLAGGLWTIE